MVIGVCDDLEIWRDDEIACLKRLDEELQEGFEYRTFESGREVIEYQGEIDILLLDVEMPEMNGIETMKLLADRDNVKAILFVSGYESYVFDAFGKKTQGYLCKPLKYEALSKKIRRIIHEWRRKQSVEIFTENGPIIIDTDELLYVKAEDNYVRILARDEEYLVYGNLKYWEEEFGKYSFIRVHKSYLVNLENISMIQNKVELKGGKGQIPLGRKYRDISRRLFDEYRIRRMREEFMF